MMADQNENCDVNNTLLSRNTFSVNEVDDFVDDKIHISETVVTVNKFELRDHIGSHDEIKQHEATTIVDNIKTEVASSEGEYNTTNKYVKSEEGIGATDVKIEFDCEHCQAYYDDYCIECGMLVHILNENAPDNLNKGLPNDILEIQNLFGQFGISALKVIPEGVKFGPFTGLCRTESAWRIKRGKFVVDNDRLHYLNWMQYINPSRNTSEGNLIVLQCEDYLYYKSSRQIQPGEELLVYFGEEFEDSLNRNDEVDFIPTMEHIVEDVFACTFCSLGFSSKSCLAKHKGICPRGAISNFSVEEVAKCPLCKIHFGQKEYLELHFPYCSVRKDILPPPPAKRHKQHHEVKMYNCGICNRRFKTKKSLWLHVENTHIYVGGEDDQEHSTTDYRNTHVKVEPWTTSDEKKIFKCSLCVFRAKHKQTLRTHIKTKHLNEFDYKCDSCEFGTNRKHTLECHIKTKHLKRFDYKCDSCKFGTNNKSNLEVHVKTNHLNEFDYKCGSCEFHTNSKCHLERHIKTKHLKAFDYKCESCEFGTNLKSNLEIHIKTNHLKEFDHKCDSCDYKTNSKSHLERHIKTNHLKKFHYKCDSCEFHTNCKCHLERHIKTNHLKEFDHKCDSCDYKTNNKRHLKDHIKTCHLKEFDHKCDSCDYKINSKSHLERHIKTNHLNKFDYKCDSCVFGTNTKNDLKTHIKTKHLKEFDYKCDSCEYRSNQKNNFKRHMKSQHSKEFDCKCDSCEFRTNVKYNLERHTKTKHLKELD